jgi:hypothetical protein
MVPQLFAAGGNRPSRILRRNRWSAVPGVLYTGQSLVGSIKNSSGEGASWRNGCMYVLHLKNPSEGLGGALIGHLCPKIL